MKYKALSSELYQYNRKRFIREMKPGAIAIINSNDQMPRSGDQYFPFRQNAGMFYLSGIDQEESMLLLFPDCPREGHKEVLLIKRTNEHIAVWEGHKYTKEEASAVSGVEKVYFLDEAEVMLNEMILLSEGIYLNINENDRFLSPVEHRDLRYARSIQQRYPAHTIYRAQPILKKLQMVKSQWEIDVLQHCVDITGNTFRRVLDFVKPGVWEYEVEAEIIHEFVRSGTTGHAYQPIIGSGKNACVLHYIENNQQCKDGDMLLMDFGCEYANYNADLTRTIPVNGVFTDRQRAVYNAVHRVLVEARALLVPGNTIDELNKEVGKIMESELLGLGLISRDDIEKQSEDKPAYKKYFMHGTSHHLGLDVHDLMGRYEPFRAGMVFTCEPGIYILEENLGVRLENDILITDNGPVDLFKNIPIDAEEIEELMHAGVMG
ncbi:MAG: aminopeptidase P N-terminal domain-containing protein [Lewinellaceae bacterium]|jgi:Xaa-Pro aminopeptidase|nr:aminopeptidase P N-terminal domain-containing protein [Lewinellaceae bacterium]